MFSVAFITLKGVFKDRVFYGVCIVASIFLVLPVVASLSLRQVEQLSLTLSLSLMSFILLLLAVFLGGLSLWKDIDRRHTYTLLGLPISRTSFLLGKFSGIALFLVIVVAFLTIVSAGVFILSSGNVPMLRPLNWNSFLLAVVFDLLKYVLLVAIAFLFSAISTSFILPVFGTIAIFLVGSATQEAFDFIHTESGSHLPLLVKKATTSLYYLLPNFSAFDLKLNVIYGLPLNLEGLLMTFVYFVLYLCIVLSVATFAFSRRELK